MAVLTRHLKPSSIHSPVSLLRRSISIFASTSTAPATTDPRRRNYSTYNISPREDPKNRNFQWVFLGSPGVGKGTYASRLCKLFGMPHIATGDLVREAIADKSGPLSDQVAEIVNQGKLVPDEIIISLLSKRLEIGESNGESGFILDGFPRTIRQAEILDEVTDIDLVVNLKLREDVLVEKCLGRRICGECKKGFNVATINVKPENGRPGMSMAPLLPPAHCTSKLITRSDDTEAIITERIRIYKEKSQPVEDFYRNQGKLMDFDLPGGIPESWPELVEALRPHWSCKVAPPNLDELEEKRSAAA